MSDLTVYISNDNVIKLSGLVDNTGAYLNSATVVVTLIDGNNVEVVGATWPLTMYYVAASNGNYEATLASTLTLSEENYTAIVDADGGAGRKGYWKCPVIAEYRTK